MTANAIKTTTTGEAATPDFRVVFTNEADKKISPWYVTLSFICSFH